MFTTLLEGVKTKLCEIIIGALAGLLFGSVLLNVYLHGQINQYQKDANQAQLNCTKKQAAVAKASYQQAAQIERDAAAAREKTLKDRLDLYSKLIQQSNAENAKLTKNLTDAQRTILEVRRHDKTVDALFSIPIPAAIRDNPRLRHDEGP
jgi:hypothetical protein